MVETKQINKYLGLILNSSFIVFIGLALSKILSYSYRIVIARFFGVEMYGVFSLAVIISSWFVTLTGLGLSEGILRYLVIYKNRSVAKSKYILSYISIISLVSSLIGAIILFSCAEIVAVKFFKEAYLTAFLRGFSLIVPFFTFAHIYLSLLRAFEKIAWYSFILNVFQNVIKLLALVLLILLGLESNAIIASHIMAIVGMFILSYLIARKVSRGLFSSAEVLNSGEKKDLRNQVFTYSLPLVFFNLMYVIFYWIDSISLGYYRGSFVVGLYNAALPIALLLGIIPELFMQLFLPIITGAYSRKEKALIEQLSKQVVKWIYTVNLPLFILIFLFPEQIIAILFGSEFIGAAQALRILSLGSIITSIFTVWQQITYAQGKSAIFLKNMLIASALNASLNFVLIPMEKIWFLDNHLGLEGASIATLISVICFNLLFTKGVREYLPTAPFRRKMLNVSFTGIVAAIIITITISIYPQIAPTSIFSLIMVATFFTILYVALLWIFRSFDKHDLEISDVFLRKIGPRNVSRRLLNKLRQ